LKHQEGKSKKTDLEPRAYLREIQNVLPGLFSRTRIIRVLRKDWKSAGKISKETGLSYKVVNYHLHLMENEKIVARRSGRPRVWNLTGLGQQRIISNYS
jgi:predicted transcriptional regulator